AWCLVVFFFFFQAEDGIRDGHVTGVQTCALPIWAAGYVRVPDGDLGAHGPARVERVAVRGAVVGGVGRIPREAREQADQVRHLRSEERRVGKECRSQGGGDQ